MKNIASYYSACILALLPLLNSCKAVTGIFKAGVNVGIFIVIAFVAIIVLIILGIGKKKS